MERDELYDIFSQYLNEADPEKFVLKDFTYEVAGDYIACLMKKGNIPQKMLDILEGDIREEIEIMFKKTTYGFMSLKEYKASKRILLAKKKAA